MTKTLTEQWKKKELKDGDYYVLNKAGDIVCDYYIEILGHFDSVLTENVKEVLAPVPSYQEFVQQRDFVKDHLNVLIENMNLKRKLEIATKALEEIHQPSVGSIYNFETDELDNTKLQDIAYKAIKEMEGVK